MMSKIFDTASKLSELMKENGLDGVIITFNPNSETGDALVLTLSDKEPLPLLKEIVEILEKKDES